MKRIVIEGSAGTMEGVYVEASGHRLQSPVLFFHGWMSDSQRGYRNLPARLALRGMPCLSVDLPGHGRSHGDRDHLSYRDCIDMALQAADELRRLSGCDKISLVGTSLGGFLAARVAGERPVDRLVLCVPTDFADELVETGARIADTALTDAAFVWRSTPHAPSDSGTLRAFSAFRGRCLIVEAQNDEMVPHQTTQNYLDAADRADGGVDYFVISNTTHRLSEQPDKQDFICSLIEMWLGRDTGQIDAVTADSFAARANLLSVKARIYVESIDRSLPFYQALTGDEIPQRFTHQGTRVVKIGVFLLIEHADAGVRSHAATIAVADVEAVARIVESFGGRLVEGPAAGPNGVRLVACHPEGTVIEYVQTTCCSGLTV